MKIRTGFVSNSSTSSFLMKGFKVEFDELKDLFPEYDWDVENWYDARVKLEDIFRKNKEVKFQISTEIQEIYIGKFLEEGRYTKQIFENFINNSEQFIKEMNELCWDESDLKNMEYRIVSEFPT